jgi:hypothetical protein
MNLLKPEGISAREGTLSRTDGVTGGGGTTYNVSPQLFPTVSEAIDLRSASLSAMSKQEAGVAPIAD